MYKSYRPEATVAVCKCKETHKTFGVRFEKVMPGCWKYTWAFPMKESAAEREGYDRTIIDGMIMPDENYPNCPYCGSRHFVVCECGRLNCSIPGATVFTCEWCGRTGTLSEYDGAGISSGGDR